MKELLLFGMLLASKEAATPNAAALHNLGATYYNAGDFAHAEDVYKRALALWGSEREAASTLNNLGALYRAQGKYKQAEECYRKALQANPGSTKVMANLAELYRVLGRFDEAKQLAERAGDEPGAQNVLAAIDRREGRLEQALKRYRKLTNVYPPEPVAYGNMAEILIVMGRYTEAEDVARKASTLLTGPKQAAALNNLAQAIRLQGRLVEPEALYTKALAIWKSTVGDQNPDYARALRNVAEYYMQIGKYSEAQDMYQQAEKTLHRSLGKNDPETVAASRGLNHVYAVRGFILPLK